MGFVAEGDPRSDCSTLIMPAISLGNVGQLAVDLLVSSTIAERVGYLDDPFVLPCVGNDAYSPSNPGKLALPLEVYEAPTLGITLIEQRSPVVKGMMIDFGRNLTNFAISSKKKHAIILSSLDFGRWKSIETSSDIYYISSTNSNGTDDECERLGWKRLQDYNPAQPSWKLLTDLAECDETSESSLPDEDDLEQEDYYATLPFAALFSCLKAKGLKVTCLLCYCSEGDNTGDAFRLAEAALKLNGCEGVEWKIPYSWRTVYGPPPDMSMF